MVWLSKTLRTQEEIDNYKEHECFRPWSLSHWASGKVRLEVVEYDRFFKQHDEHPNNPPWGEVYTRTIGFLLWVDIPEIPEDVLIQSFKDTIQHSDVNKYYRDTCLETVQINRTYHDGIVLSWCESEHNPEWVCYEMRQDLFRMIGRLTDKYAPDLKKEVKKRK